MERDAIRMQNEASWYAQMAMWNRDGGDLNAARHFQWLAVMAWTKYWQIMMSLLTREPII